MIDRIVFVTTELEPFVPGGAGKVIADNAARLVAEGFDVEVVLTARSVDEPASQRPYRLTIKVPPREDGHLARSRAAAEALAEIDPAGRGLLIEFQDFHGLAFWALTHRADLGLTDATIAIRFHGPADLILEHMETVPTDLAVARLMEREAFAMADVVIVPSDAIADLAVEHFTLDRGRVVIGEPPSTDLPVVGYEPGPHPEFIALGRLAEVKGSTDFLDAGIQFLSQNPDGRIRFVGEDGWHPGEGRWMREVLASRVPNRLRDRVSFDPPVARDELGQALRTAWAVVVPSRFESYCLAAHDVRRLGLPLVVADLPAFTGFFSEATGAVMYDGSVAGLQEAMQALAHDRERLERLARAPSPPRSDPVAVYRSELPPPRHPRSQAGLATRANHTIEEATKVVERSSSAAQRALEVLPQWAVPLLVKVLPQSVKDRFRRKAAWPAEAARREMEKRRRAMRAAIAAGSFPELESPDVSIIVPCFDQGGYLHEALLSVFEQTFRSFEIVVIDDGSTDPTTLRVLDRLDLPRIRLIRQANRGLPAARNAGIDIARGRYVVPLDADDVIAPRFLETLIAAIQSDERAAYAHCWSRLFGAQDVIWVPRPWNAYQLLLANSVVGCLLLRRDAWESAGGYDESLIHGNEDWDLWVRLAGAGWGQVQVREALFHYRKHGISMTAATEARFEAARSEMVARHPDLYGRESLAGLKASWYPWVSVLVDESTDLTGQHFDDLEVVPVGELSPTLAAFAADRGWPIRPQVMSVEEGVRYARGKFVADWVGMGGVSDDLLAMAARALEDAPRRLGVEVAGSGAVAMWRRWPLVDAAAGHEGFAVVEGHASGRSRLAAGCCEIEAWTAPADVDGVPVQRDSPEAEGPLPGWVT